MIAKKSNISQTKADLLTFSILDILRNDFNQYDKEYRQFNESVLNDFISTIKNRLIDDKLSREEQNRLINLLDELLDLYEAQSEPTTFDTIETAEGMTIQQYEEYLKNTPGWRLHQKFQSSLENKATSPLRSK